MGNEIKKTKSIGLKPSDVKFDNIIGNKLINNIFGEKKIVEELDFINDKFNDTLNYINSVKNRADGLIEDDFINSLTSQDLSLLKEVMMKEKGLNASQFTDEIFYNELKNFYQKVNRYSKENGCGAYNILALLNGKYGLNFSKEYFFGHVLINSFNSSGSLKNWYRQVNRDSGRGPIDDNGAMVVLNYINKNFGTNIGYKKLNDIPENERDDALKNWLKSGGSAVIMLKKGDGNIDFDKLKKTMANENDIDSLKNDFGPGDNTWANSRHYVLIRGIDEDGNLQIVDARKFSDSDKGHERKSSYEDLSKYIVHSESSSDFGVSGCLLIT